MSARVNIESEAWNDPKFITLARLCGFADADHALIKCARIWGWQTENFTPEKPTYVVDQDTIEAFLGPGGAAAMVRAKLADEQPDGFLIRGSEGRIEWLYRLRVASAKGGEVTKRNARDKHRPDGQPAGQPNGRPSLGPKPGPLSSGSGSGSPEETNELTRARAIPPAQYETGRPEHRYQLAERTYHRVSDERIRIAKKYGLEEPLAFPPITPSSVTRGFRDLRERLLEEGDGAPAACELVIANLVEQAEAERSLEWLSEKAFTEGGWRFARNGDWKQRARGRPSTQAPKQPAKVIPMADSYRRKSTT